jgi:hypothetical protein
MIAVKSMAARPVIDGGAAAATAGAIANQRVHVRCALERSERTAAGTAAISRAGNLRAHGAE